MDSLEREWEAKLTKLGMPSEPLSEQEKAAEEGVELETLDTDETNTEARMLAKKLIEEDPRNVFGGFSVSIDNLLSLVKTLEGEWLAEGIPAKDIRLAVHASCINGHDCVAVTYNGGKVYHYNTKNIRRYSRQKLIEKFKSQRLSIIEK